VVVAMKTGATDTVRFDSRPTLAEGASIAEPVRGREVLAALRQSNGDAIAIEEQEIIAAREFAAHQGVYIEPTSALAVSGTRLLLASGAIGRMETVVTIISGHGLKSR
jgi:threonine synthase